MSTIYLDNAATTRMDGQVATFMRQYEETYWGNPSSMHRFGSQLQHHLDEAREKVAAFIGAKHATEIVFTSGGSESNNTAIYSALATQPTKRHIITSSIEHSSIDKYCRHWMTQGYTVTFLSVDRQGRLDIDQLKDTITDDTALVSIMWANNETGVIFPIEEIAAICQEKKVLFHTDAIQAVGKIPLSIAHMPIHTLPIAGHKIHGPKGIGALYVKRGLPFQPLIVGGGQERGRRGGTENVPGIVGLGEACRLAGERLGEMKHVETLRHKLEEELRRRLPEITINGGDSPRVPTTTNIGFPGIESETLIMMLSESHLAVSSGSACTSFSVEPSRVLTAMGLPTEIGRGSLRFSLSHSTTEKEIIEASAIVETSVTRLRHVMRKS